MKTTHVTLLPKGDRQLPLDQRAAVNGILASVRCILPNTVRIQTLLAYIEPIALTVCRG